MLPSDESFAALVENFYSHSGSVLFVNSTPIAWRSGRQKVRAQSTTEAEWIAAADGLRWVTEISCLEFFENGNEGNINTELPKDLLVMCDNKSAVAITKTDEVRKKSRHYALRLINIRKERSRVIFCRTELMCADALTKPVAGKQRRLLLGFNSRIPPS